MFLVPFPYRCQNSLVLTDKIIGAYNEASSFIGFENTQIKQLSNVIAPGVVDLGAGVRFTVETFPIEYVVDSQLVGEICLDVPQKPNHHTRLGIGWQIGLSTAAN